MQVANTLNNTIRILFNPKMESFRLFDFLMVKSDDSKYIAQITEIYDDKFDSSQNVAKIKLFYRITDNNEVMPYDNFTPNKECEIIKVKQEEIENFINQDKKTFIFGTNIKSSSALNLQYDFFENNPVILADKIENANSVTYNLAKNLSEQKNVVIIDQTGVLDYEDAKKIVASKNFRMPLNYTTIDCVMNKCLADSSLEFQAIGSEIINEIKRFAKRQENEFIPFNHLTRVLIQQYKATPYPELRLLLARLKKHQMEEIFAKTKNDKDNLFKAIEKNKITIVDLSTLEAFWQKAYLEYITSDITQDIYLIARVNDEHFDTELINKIYNKKKNISFVPNVSYNYKRLPSVMQHCKNYILMPSLFQRADFLDANFALSNLIAQGCVVFGENTDNFLYLARDYELEVQEKRKNYRKIALSLMKNDENVEQKLGQKGDYFENQEKAELNKQQEINQEEYNNGNAELEEFVETQEENVFSEVSIQEEASSIREETFNEIENPLDENINQMSELEEKLELAAQQEEQKETDDFQELDIAKTQDEPEQELFEETIQEKTEEDLLSSDNDSKEANSEESGFEISDAIAQQETDSVLAQDNDDFLTPTEEKVQKENIFEEKDDLPSSETTTESIETNDVLENKIEEKEQEEQDVDISDEELDFFQMALDSDIDDDDNDETKSETVKENSQENYTTQEQEIQINDENDDIFSSSDTEDIDLEKIADSSIDDNFNDIINSKKSQETKKDDISDDFLNSPPKEKESLPIFKDEEKTESSEVTYEIGNVIIHKKYGRGTVVKIIKYEERQLLQIEFDSSEKKLLDPKIAQIELEQ